MNYKKLVGDDVTYRIKSVRVSLEQKFQVEGYPVESEIEDLFADRISNYLCSRVSCVENTSDVHNDVVDLVFNIKYRRRFVGEVFGYKSSVTNAIVSYKNLIMRDEKVLKEFLLYNGILHRGLIGNMKVLLTLFFRGVDDERKDIEDFVRIMSSEIVRFIR